MRNRARLELIKVQNASQTLLSTVLEGIDDVWASLSFIVDLFNLRWEQTAELTTGLMTLWFLANRNLPTGDIPGSVRSLI